MPASGRDARGASRLTETELPAWVREGTSLVRVDYSDSYLVENVQAASMSAEQWAREVLEGAPASFRFSAPPAWFLLGLRHGASHSPRHVLGWPIRVNTADRIILCAPSRIGMPAELVFGRQGDAWLFATLLQQDNAFVATIWNVIAARHRHVVRQLLRSAAARVTRAAP